MLFWFPLTCPRTPRRRGISSRVCRFIRHMRGTHRSVELAVFVAVDRQIKYMLWSRFDRLFHISSPSTYLSLNCTALAYSMSVSA